MQSPYTVGDTAVLTATIKDQASGDPIDPAGVIFKVLPPGTGVSWSEVTATSSSTGVWTAQQVVNVGGYWWWRVETSGPYGAAERRFYVNASPFV